VPQGFSDDVRLVYLAGRTSSSAAYPLKLQ